jgi:hypothetical protein
MDTVNDGRSISHCASDYVEFGPRSRGGRAYAHILTTCCRVGSVASLVRKLLAQLAKDGLVTGVAGRSGGVRLARPASEITLAEIYRSVMQGGPLWSARKDIPHRCIVSTHMDDFCTLERIFLSSLIILMARLHLLPSQSISPPASCSVRFPVD